MSTSFEEQYYEQEAFWVPGALRPADEDRIRVATSRIPSDVRSIVDVGCGNGLFLNHLVDQHGSRFDRVMGVDRSTTALRYVRAESVHGAIDALPIPDGSFDLATCMEVIEHLPLSVFDAALRELARVSRRYIMVTVPNDEDLSVSFVPCPSCGCVFNFNYHLRNFDEAKLNRLFAGTHDCLAVFPIGMEKAFRPSALRAYKFLRSVSGRVDPALLASAVCPMCGYHGDAGEGRKSPPSGGGVTKRNKVLAPLRQVLSRVAVMQRPVWLGALYQRRA